MDCDVEPGLRCRNELIPGVVLGLTIHRVGRRPDLLERLRLTARAAEPDPKGRIALALPGARARAGCRLGPAAGHSRKLLIADVAVDDVTGPVPADRLL